MNPPRPVGESLGAPVQSVVHPPVQPARAPTASPLSWAPTLRLGVVASVVAVLVALVVHALTPLPTIVIVVGLATGAFALSWQAGTRRRRRS